MPSLCIKIGTAVRTTLVNTKRVYCSKDKMHRKKTKCVALVFKQRLETDVMEKGVREKVAN